MLFTGLLCGCINTPTLCQQSKPIIDASWYAQVVDGPNEKDKRVRVYIAVVNRGERPENLDKIAINEPKSGEGCYWIVDKPPKSALQPGMLAVFSSDYFSRECTSGAAKDATQLSCEIPLHLAITTHSAPQCVTDITVAGLLPTTLPDGWTECPLTQPEPDHANR
jgi:hypothetical protein